MMGMQVGPDFQNSQKIREEITKFIIANGTTMLELSGVFSVMSWT